MVIKILFNMKYMDTVKFRKNHPKKVKANRVVYVNIRNGNIKSKPCLICKSLKSEAHHENYMKPLKIIWLCKKHHIIADKIRRERIK